MLVIFWIVVHFSAILSVLFIGWDSSILNNSSDFGIVASLISNRLEEGSTARSRPTQN